MHDSHQPVPKRGSQPQLPQPHRRMPTTVGVSMDTRSKTVALIRAVFYFISSFPFLFVLAVGGLVFEFCVFVAVWRHAACSSE